MSGTGLYPGKVPLGAGMHMARWFDAQERWGATSAVFCVGGWGFLGALPPSPAATPPEYF